MYSLPEYQNRARSICAPPANSLPVALSRIWSKPICATAGVFSTPSAKLDVAGNINVSGNIAAKYQDVAEWVETRAPIEAGTVVVIDPSEPNRVLPASKAYDTRVAGSVSAKPA